MDQTIQSMKRLLDFKTERLVLFTSVGKIIEDGRAALEGCIAYLENLSMKDEAFEGQRLYSKRDHSRIFSGVSRCIRSPFFEGKP